jgi:hypothetical protein
MLNDSIKTLAATSPKIAFVNVRDCAKRVTELENILGIKPSKPTWNIVRANARIAELESMLTDRTAAPVPAPTEAARVAPGIVATAFQFNALCAADRESFSANGGELSVDAFNSLPLAARVKHFESGGKIAGAPFDKTVLAPRVRGESNPANSRTMAANAFNQIGKNDQKTLIRLGLKIAVK